MAQKAQHPARWAASHRCFHTRTSSYHRAWNENCGVQVSYGNYESTYLLQMHATRVYKMTFMPVTSAFFFIPVYTPWSRKLEYDFYQRGKKKFRGEQRHCSESKLTLLRLSIIRRAIDHSWWRGVLCTGGPRKASPASPYRCRQHRTHSAEITYTTSKLTPCPLGCKMCSSQKTLIYMINIYFLGTSLVVDSTLSIQGAQVQSLVGELRSHRPCVVAKREKQG